MWRSLGDLEDEDACSGGDHEVQGIDINFDVKPVASVNELLREEVMYGGVRVNAGSGCQTFDIVIDRLID